MTIYAVRQRVACYVTRSATTATGTGTQLLVFDHVDDDPDSPSGTQIPAGGKSPYEAIDQAAYRETEEETGLNGLTFVRQLGVVELGLQDAGGPSVTTYVELNAPTIGPDSWQQVVGGDGLDAGMTFACRWADLPLDFELAAGQGVYLDQLV